MARAYHLAIDIGAGSGRAISGWLENGIMRMEELHRFTTDDMVLHGQRVRNVYRWQEEIALALGKFASNHNALESMGVDAMGEDFALIDAQGNLLKMPPAYRDVSVDSEVQEIEEARYGNLRLYEVCGNQSVNNDTLRQLIKLGLEKDSVLDRAASLLFFGDLFHFFLCGSRAVEHSLASYGKLFSQKNQAWDDSIFSAFGFPPGLKAPIVRCGERLGSVYRALWKDAGLFKAPEVVAPATHDSACAAFAAMPGERTVFISSGSWSIIGIRTDEPILTEAAWRFNCSNSSMPLRANMFKKLVAGAWVIQRCQREWAKYSFSQIVSLARRARENRFFFDPDDPALFNPRSMTQTLSEFAGRQGTKLEPDDVGAMARAVFESQALKYRFTIEKLKDISGRGIEDIRIVGGGSWNVLVNQFTANACGLPVSTGIKEASAAGNLLSQMIGCGEISGEAEAREILARSFTQKIFEPRDRDTWEEKFSRFVKIIRGEPGPAKDIQMKEI